MQGRLALVLATLLSGCADDGEQSWTLSSSATLIGKCTFGNGPDIDVGEVFVYAVVEAGAYTVLTGTAEHAEPLTTHSAAQTSGRVFGATPDGTQLDFGDDKYIGLGTRSGEIYNAAGETYGTQSVYPLCVSWPDPE